jgi:predicted dehydrogenase
MKIGILGAGAMGNAHINGFRSMERQNGEYAAICDIDEARCRAFGEKYGLKTYFDLYEMLHNPEIEMVDICLPSFMHEEFAVKIAAAKKHILVEKPIAFTVEAAQNIYDAAEKNGVRIMVAQVLRFWPEYLKIKEIYEAGEIGDIVTIYAARLGQMVTWGEWYKDPEKSGETLMNLTLHDIDFLHYMLGKPKSVYSAGRKDEKNNYNDVMNIFKFQNGVNAMVDGSFSMTAGYPFTMRMRVLGTKGTLEFTFISGENIGPESTSSLIMYKPDDGGKKVEVKSYDAYGREIQYFLDCIAKGSPTETVSQKSILTVLSSVIAAKASLADGLVHNL